MSPLVWFRYPALAAISEDDRDTCTYCGQLCRTDEIVTEEEGVFRHERCWQAMLDDVAEEQREMEAASCTV